MYITYADIEDFLNIDWAAGQTLANTIIAGVVGVAEQLANQSWSVDGNQTVYFDVGANTFL